MEEKRTNKWILPVAIGCVVLLCLCGLIIGGFFFVSSRTGQELPFNIGRFTDGGLLPQPADENVQPAGPVATVDVEEPPTDPDMIDPSLTGGQYITDTALFDDFSSDAIGWLEYNDGSTIIQYEDQMYSFEITETDYLDWTYVPAPFYPSTIQFDVQARPGPVDGSFGVNCQYVDEDNHYYVEIDLGFQDAIFAMVRDGEFVPLTEADDEGQYWQNLDNLNSPPDSVNTIQVNCTQDKITLWVNGQLEYEILVSDPLDGPGDMALFLYTYENAASGYKVYFDNVLVEE